MREERGRTWRKGKIERLLRRFHTCRCRGILRLLTAGNKALCG